jgi:hypothetical protein
MKEIDEINKGWKILDSYVVGVSSDTPAGLYGHKTVTVVPLPLPWLSTEIVPL